MTAPSQPPTKTPAPRALRPWTDFDQLTAPRPAERKAIGSAVLLTLVFHAMLFAWILPWLGTIVKDSRPLPPPPGGSIRPAPPVEYAITPATPEDLQALRYVEANPNAPAAKPDATNNISNRDQRVAQPTPNPDGHSDLPATNGTVEQSVRIVPGANQPQPPAPPPPTPSPVVQNPAPTPAPATAPPVVIASNRPTLLGNTTTDNGDGIRIANKPNDAILETKGQDLPPTLTQQNQRMLPPGPLTPETLAAVANATTPATRLQAIVKAHDGPLVKNIEGTHVGGVAPGLDARLTPFGEYLSLVYEAIASAWYTQCEQFTFSPRDWGTQVDVAFVLNAQGEVEDVQIDRSTASRSATLLCQNAVRTPAPYAKWPEEMRAMLGEHYTLHVTFYYE